MCVLVCMHVWIYNDFAHVIWRLRGSRIFPSCPNSSARPQWHSNWIPNTWAEACWWSTLSVKSSWKAGWLETQEEPMFLNFEFRGRTGLMSQLGQRARQEELLASRTVSALCSVQAFSWLDEAPHGREGDLLCCLLVQVLIWEKNTLIDTLRNNVCPGILTWLS